jgi:transcriptional regulator with XRE-family HTH domain
VSSPTPLSNRLRELRADHFGAPVTQRVLSLALGVSAPTISSWETGVAVPTEERLEDIARFFATARSVDERRLFGDNELTEDERVEREKLLAQLSTLRPNDPADTASRPPPADTDFWRFADDGPVRIICGQREILPPEADGKHHNYMALTSYADLDSLVELFGHIRACNPSADVRFARPGLLRDDDLPAHLVFLGNMAAIQSTVQQWLPDLPVRQVKISDIDEGEIFEVVDDGAVERFGPVLAEDDTVVEDVGFLARLPHPTDPDRTLTICSGIFTRGVYGAVRCLTDQSVARINNAYVRSRFADVDMFGLLMRVLVVPGLLSTPRLDDRRARLFEFP